MWRVSTQSCSVSNNVSVYSTSLTYTCLQIPIKGEILGCNLIQPNNFYYYNIQNESLSQQAIYTFWCWTSFQKGLRPDRPTQPETWRSSEALQECKKNQQQIVPLQPEVKVGCRRGCAQHVLRLCLRKSWPSCRSSKRTFQRICGNRFWFWFRLHVWYRIEGVNRMSFPPKRPFSEPTQISRKKAFKLSLNHPRTYTCPLPSASHILVPGLKTIFLLWKPPCSTSKLSS